MPTFTIESSKFPEGFPDGTRLRIEAISGERMIHKKSAHRQILPLARDVVWQGEVAGSMTKSWDPGKYTWSAIGTHDWERFKEVGTFFVGMTQKQFTRISRMEPKTQSPRMTSDGIRWNCNQPGCKKINTSKIAALLHEASVHYGTDLLEASDPKAEKKALDEKIEQQVKRGPGRPRKAEAMLNGAA